MVPSARSALRASPLSVAERDPGAWVPLYTSTIGTKIAKAPAQDTSHLVGEGGFERLHLPSVTHALKRALSELLRCCVC